MTTNSFMSFLMDSTDGTTWEKLLDVVDYPDVGSTPESIDTTTLSDRARTYIQGIDETSQTLEFNANYTPEDFARVYALRNQTRHYAIWLGGTDDGINAPTPTGNLGKFAFEGMASVRLSGAGVNEKRGMVVALTASTPITFTVPSGN